MIALCCSQAALVSTAFKELSPKEKKRYEDMANMDKERYKKEMESYVPPSYTSDASDSDGDSFATWESLREANGVRGHLLCDGTRMHDRVVLIHLPLGSYKILCKKMMCWDFEAMEIAALLLHDFCKKKKHEKKNYFFPAVLTDCTKTEVEGDFGDLEVFYSFCHTNKPKSHYVLLRVSKSDKSVEIIHHQDVLDMSRLVSIAQPLVKQLGWANGIASNVTRNMNPGMYVMNVTAGQKEINGDINYCGPYAWIMGVKALEKDLEAEANWGMETQPGFDLPIRTEGTIMLGKALSSFDVDNMMPEGVPLEKFKKMKKELSGMKDNEWLNYLLGNS